MIQAKPVVSVGISVFNAEHTLASAIVSVLNQTMPAWELILIDDGSGDRSARIASEFAARFKQITFIPGEKNLGLAPRLNQFTQLARAELVARMDADDLMHPTRLDRQVRFLADNPSVDVVGSSAFVVDRHSRVSGLLRSRTIKACKRLRYLQFIHPTVMARRSWFIEHPYSADFVRCEDAELWARTGGGANMASIETPLLYYNRAGAFAPGKAVKSLKGYEAVIRANGKRLCPICRFKSIIWCRVKASAYYIASAIPGAEEALERRAAPMSRAELDGAQCTLVELLSMGDQFAAEILSNTVTICKSR